VIEPKFISSLECLGLTSTEARAYLVLIEDGVLSAEAVAGKIGVHYPAVYRVLDSLEQKGWVEVAHGRPKQYRARNPNMVASEAKKTAINDLESAAALTATLEDRYGVKNDKEDGDLWIYKGPQAVFNKLKEVVLSTDEDILAVSTRPEDRSVLEKVVDILSQGSVSANLLVHQSNAKDVREIRPGLRRGIHVDARISGRPPGSTRLNHTFVFPNEREVFIINTVYKDDELIEDRTIGLWISDADYVRMHLDDMMAHTGH